jgi:hypothetical protein
MRATRFENFNRRFPVGPQSLGNRGKNSKTTFS